MTNNAGNCDFWNLMSIMRLICFDTDMCVNVSFENLFVDMTEWSSQYNYCVAQKFGYGSNGVHNQWRKKIQWKRWIEKGDPFPIMCLSKSKKCVFHLHILSIWHCEKKGCIQISKPKKFQNNRNGWKTSGREREFTTPTKSSCKWMDT